MSVHDDAFAEDDFDAKAEYNGAPETWRAAYDAEMIKMAGRNYSALHKHNRAVIAARIAVGLSARADGGINKEAILSHRTAEAGDFGNLNSGVLDPEYQAIKTGKPIEAEVDFGDGKGNVARVITVHDHGTRIEVWVCQWVGHCTDPAVYILDHPRITDGVPTCAKHADWLGRK